MSTENNVKELTPDQLSRIGEFRERWTKIGLNCEPAKRDQALVHFREAYESIKAPPPRYTVWAQSPLMGCFMCGLFSDPEKGAYKWLDKFNGALDPVRAIATNESIDISDWDCLTATGELKDGTTLSLANAWKTLWVQLFLAEHPVDAPTENKDLTYSIEIIAQQINPSLDGIMRIGKVMFDEYVANRLQEVESAGRQKAWDACYGSHDASWLGFYEFFRDVVRYEKCNELNGLIGAAKCAGWFWPFESLCIASERHDAIHLDTNERLSNLKGPAVHYRDGFAISAVQGVAVPDWLVNDPKALTSQHIINERNQEVRRIMLSHFMPRAQFLKDIGAKMIQEDEFGKLWRGRSGDIEISAVEVVNGTIEKDGSRKTYFIGALNAHQTAKSAVSWSYNLTENELIVAKRT